MSGLFIKDFRLMKTQKNFFILIVLVVGGMVVFYEDCTFPIGFLAFVGTLFLLSSVSYDEFDNGNAFLFSFPISRNGYVVEKYCFGLLAGIGALLLAVCMVMVAGGIRAAGVNGTGRIKETLTAAGMMLPGMIGLLSVMMPLQLKFGGEKGRIALIGVVGALLVVGILLSEGFDIDLAGIFHFLSGMGMGAALAMSILIALAVLAVSMALSMAIVKKKEF